MNFERLPIESVEVPATLLVNTNAFIIVLTDAVTWCSSFSDCSGLLLLLLDVVRQALALEWANETPTALNHRRHPPHPSPMASPPHRQRRISTSPELLTRVRHPNVYRTDGTPANSAELMGPDHPDPRDLLPDTSGDRAVGGQEHCGSAAESPSPPVGVQIRTLVERQRPEVPGSADPASPTQCSSAVLPHHGPAAYAPLDHLRFRGV